MCGQASGAITISRFARQATMSSPAIRNRRGFVRRRREASTTYQLPCGRPNARFRARVIAAGCASFQSGSPAAASGISTGGSGGPNLQI